MVTISCSGKLHAFALAEQMEKHGQLDSFFTTFASTKNTLVGRLVKRIDKELIPVEKIHTNVLLSFPGKLMPSKVHLWNNFYDKWVAHRLRKTKSTVFIGWSGMSLHAIRVANKRGLITIVERGSSHILYQNEILREEYKKFGISFTIHPAVIEKELMEYEEADYISVPSYFVRNSFTAKGVSTQKLIMNPYGAGSFFSPSEDIKGEADKFIVVYLGTLSIRKGLVYFFEALQMLHLPEDKFEVWFIGSIEANLQFTVNKYKKDNWKFFGLINHYELQQYLSKCDIGIQISLEEGLSMVIPQLMACGVPVIITPNSGGENVITDDVNGFVVPIRQPGAIAEKIRLLFHDRKKLRAMKEATVKAIRIGFTWNDYGDRYSNFINLLL